MPSSRSDATTASFVASAVAHADAGEVGGAASSQPLLAGGVERSDGGHQHGADGALAAEAPQTPLARLAVSESFGHLATGLVLLNMALL